VAASYNAVMKPSHILWLVLGAIALLCAVGWQRAVEPVPGGLLTGTYDVRLYDPSTGKPHIQDESKLPPGQRKHGIVQGKRFAVLDMMSGFQGPIRVRGKAIEFLFEEGPAGKATKVEVGTVVPSKDKKTLTVMMRGKRVMVWTWRTATPAIKLPY